MDSYQLGGIILIATVNVIFIPVLLYYLYLFHKHSDDRIFKFRSKPLIYIMNGLTIFSLLIGQPYILCVSELNIISAPEWSTFIFVATGIWAVYVLLAIKTYLLYFQQQYSISIADMTWKKDINPHDNDFYSSHKTTWGNVYFLLKIALMFVSVIMITDCVVSVYTIGMETQALIHSAFAAIPVTICYYVYWKSRHLDDIYKIRNEIYYNLVLLAIVLVIYISLFMSLQYIDNNWNTLTNICLGQSVIISISLYSTAYPVHVVLHNIYDKQYVSQNSNSKIDYKNDGNDILKVIADEKLFKLFMQYLLRELATENLLFLVELIQIKHSLQTKYKNVIRVLKHPLTGDEIASYAFNSHSNGNVNNKTENNVDIKKHFVIDFNVYYTRTQNENKHLITYLVTNNGINKMKIKLSSNIPRSKILNDYSTFNEQTIELYKKYIAIGSKFELNISHDVRQRLIKYFSSFMVKSRDNNVNIENDEFECDRFNVLDECALEILILLKGTFRRFQLTEKYLIQAPKSKLAKRISNSIEKNLPVFRNSNSLSTAKKQNVYKNMTNMKNVLFMS